MGKFLDKALKRRNARRNAMAITIGNARYPAAYKMPGSMKK